MFSVQTLFCIEFVDKVAISGLPVDDGFVQALFDNANFHVGKRMSW